MKEYIKRMIEEHKSLIKRIDTLNKFVPTINVDNVEKGEDYVLLKLQLHYMIQYANILLNRLNIEGIINSDGIYFEAVTNLKNENKDGRIEFTE